MGTQMTLTRREFLQLSACLPLVDLSRFSALPVAEEGRRLSSECPPEPNPWQFPLQFPAYFAKDPPRQRHYLPMIANDGN
jgi:hypothetical protein